MTDSEIENALVLSSVGFASCSFCCSMYVLISCTRLKRRRQKYQHRSIDENDTAFLSLIFYLSLIDCVWDITRGFNIGYEWSLQLAPACIVVGAIYQFVHLLMMFWQILIALYIFHLLTFWFNKFIHFKFRSIIIFVIIGTLSTIGTIIPFNYMNENQYGVFANYATYAHIDKKSYPTGLYLTECWLKGSWWQMVVYFVSLVAILLHLINVIITVIKYYKSPVYADRYWRLIGRLLSWPVLYSAILVFPIVDRIMGLNPNYQPNFIVVMIHSCCSSSIGIVNLIVWICFTKSSHDKGGVDGLHNRHDSTVLIKQDETMNTSKDTMSVNVIPESQHRNNEVLQGIIEH